MSWASHISSVTLISINNTILIDIEKYRIFQYISEDADAHSKYLDKMGKILRSKIRRWKYIIDISGKCASHYMQSWINDKMTKIFWLRRFFIDKQIIQKLSCHIPSLHWFDQIKTYYYLPYLFYEQSNSELK